MITISTPKRLRRDLCIYHHIPINSGQKFGGEYVGREVRLHSLPD
jgi:hypothetical protein